jgi:hypothetical protein
MISALYSLKCNRFGTFMPQHAILTPGFRVPPNVKFEVDDIENEWVYSSPFDFIHCRAMAAVIADWPRLAKQCFQLSVQLTHPKEPVSNMSVSCDIQVH